MNDDIKIIDDLLPKSYQDAIEQMVFSEEFDWHYVSDVTDQTYKNVQGYRSLDGFSHLFLGPKTSSKYLNFVMPVLYHAVNELGMPFDQSKLWRARVGLMFQQRQGDPTYNNPHVDHIMPHWTGLYYINDNDGPTYIFDQKVINVPFSKRNDAGILDYVNNTEMTIAQQVEPKKGRFVIFNGYRFHSSSRPINCDKRAVITFNWKSTEQPGQVNNGQLS